MSVRDINYLLKKYKIKQKGEIWNSEMEKEDTQKRRVDEYLAISDNICDRLYMKGSQKEEVKNILSSIQLNDLHRTAGVYTIITAVCIYVKKTYSTNNSLNWKNYKVCKEYGLTESILITVLCNLVRIYRSNSYLI